MNRNPLKAVCLIAFALVVLAKCSHAPEPGSQRGDAWKTRIITTIKR